MAKAHKLFTCQSCGTGYSKWQGQCDACKEWNTLIEEVANQNLPKGATGGQGGNKLVLESLEGNITQQPRLSTGLQELNRVCGGGLVSSMATLIGGDPGIGKSTILLQAAAHIANQKKPCFYISGEESVDQVRLRAHRLNLSKAPVQLISTTSVRDIMATLKKERPEVVIIDSIQTMYSDVLDSAPGTVAQVRTCGYEFIRLAKEQNFALFLVGHVTKEGTIAGPRVLEHMVDTVLYFEGERGHHFRILRAVKNRFGATDEIGVFEMTDKGLMEVANPSALFLAERRGNITGVSVFAGMEGTRPMLLEIQALVTPSTLGQPRRAVVGWDHNRLSMLTAVLEARAGLSLAGFDIFLNVAGGLKINEPAADLAVAAALISAKNNVPTPAQMAFFGEIGLSGEIRSVIHRDIRLKEIEKLGFKQACFPKSKTPAKSQNLQTKEMGHIQDLTTFLNTA